MAENEVDLMLELIDFDQEIETEAEKWDENGVEFEEEEFSEEWEDMPIDIPVVVEKVNDKMTVIISNTTTSSSSSSSTTSKDDKQPKAKRAKRAPLPKKFTCTNCSKKYALEYHFKKHVEICKKTTQKAKQKG